MKKIQSIEALRGVAALMVMLFHFTWSMPSIVKDYGLGFLGSGRMGVDLFFVISGFIVYHVAKDLPAGRATAREFLLKRLCRIVPLYWLVTLSVAGSTPQTWIEAARSMAFLPMDASQVGPYYGYGRLLVGWTLNYEILFYALAAGCLFLERWRWIALIGTICALAFGPALFMPWHGFNTYVGYQFSVDYLKLATNPIILEFIAGIVIGYLFHRPHAAHWQGIWLALVTVAIGFYGYCYATRFLWGSDSLTWLYPSALLVFALTQYEKRFGLSVPGPLLALGGMSFSVYLLHLGTIRTTERILRRFEFSSPYAWEITLVGLGLVFTLLLSTLSKRMVEVRLYVWLTARLRSTAPKNAIRSAIRNEQQECSQ